MSRGEYLSPDQVARALGGLVTAETVRRWIHEGKLPACRTPGGRFLIFREDIALVLEPPREEE